jgi:hypothetical protein
MLRSKTGDLKLGRFLPATGLKSFAPRIHRHHLPSVFFGQAGQLRFHLMAPGPLCQRPLRANSVKQLVRIKS